VSRAGLADCAPRGGGPARPGRPGSAARAALPVATAALVLRLPALLEPHHYSDEGIFAATAQRLLQGHALYTGSWDDKPPLVYLVYAAVLALAGASMVALRLLTALWVAAAAVGVGMLGRRLCGARGGLTAGLLFALLASLPLLEANLALTEIFAATPVVWAFVLVAGASGAGATRRLTLAGALLAVGALFKQVAALDAAAAGVFLLLVGRGAAPSRDAGRFARVAALAAGFAVPLLLAAALLAATGALGEALYATGGFYGVYLREGAALPPMFTALKPVPAALAVAVAVRAARRRGAGARELVLLWLGFAVLGATLAGRPFGHYLVQALAPLALAVVLVGHDLVHRRMALGPAAVTAAAALALGLGAGRFWLSYDAVRPAYYARIARYALGWETRDGFERFFSWRVPNQRRLAALVRADGDRTLFVWGDYPWLYALAGAENPTRYATSYQTSFVPGAKAEVIDALRRTPPRFIVTEATEWRRLPGLAALLQERYEPVAVVDNSTLYRRRDGAP
jgi:4-amino-4-deoxy-L-arabinose transferase-like glycosyltransferase